MGRERMCVAVAFMYLTKGARPDLGVHTPRGLSLETSAISTGYLPKGAFKQK